MSKMPCKKYLSGSETRASKLLKAIFFLLRTKNIGENNLVSGTSASK
jgi:hypothetical protein